MKRYDFDENENDNSKDDYDDFSEEEGDFVDDDDEDDDEMQEHDFLENEEMLRELEISFQEERDVSDIPNTTSFVYYYKYKHQGVAKTMKACYSHKYKSAEFKKYIEETLPKQEVHFEIINDICSYGDSVTRQYLVLLRKISKVKTVVGKKISTISNKEKEAVIKILEGVNKDIGSSLVNYDNGQNIINNYKLAIQFINSNTSTDENLKSIINIVKTEKANNNLINLGLSIQIVNLTK